MPWKHKKTATTRKRNVLCTTRVFSEEMGIVMFLTLRSSLRLTFLWLYKHVLCSLPSAVTHFFCRSASPQKCFTAVVLCIWTDYGKWYIRGLSECWTFVQQDISLQHERNIAQSQFVRVGRVWQSFNVFLCKIFRYQLVLIGRCSVMNVLIPYSLKSILLFFSSLYIYISNLRKRSPQ